MFVKYLQPAHESNRSTSKFQSKCIPNWPHLKDHTPPKFDCVNVSAVEGVHFVAPDINNMYHYWAVIDSGRVLWHERYWSQHTGDEGNLDDLEPDHFLSSTTPQSDSDSDDGDASPSAQRHLGPDDIDDSDIRAAEADEYAEGSAWLWEGADE
jgi:hypothetical protein